LDQEGKAGEEAREGQRESERSKSPMVSLRQETETFIDRRPPHNISRAGCLTFD